MPRYVLLAKANPAGSEDVLTWREEGAKAYDSYVERVGGRVIDHYIVTGSYDLVLVVEFDDELASLAFSLISGAGGLYVEPLRAFSTEELAEAASRLPEVEQARELARTESEELEKILTEQGGV